MTTYYKATRTNGTTRGGSLALPPAYTEHIGRALHAHTMTQEAT